MAKKKKVDVAAILKKFDADNWEQHYLQTGIIPIDLVTAGKGIALGRVSQFYSSSGFGKSTTLLSVCKSLAIKKVGTWFCAIEPAKKLAEDMGCAAPNIKEYFHLLDLQTYSELEAITDAFLESDAQLLIIDSLTAVTPSKLALGEAGLEESNPGIDARITSSYLKIYSGLIKRLDKAIIYINQSRANFDGGWNGDPEKAEGGFASKFYADVRWSMRGDGQLKGTDLGQESKARIGKIGYLYPEKCRHNQPYARIPIQVIFGKGVSNVYSCEQYLKWQGAIASGGASFAITWQGERHSVKGKIGKNKWIQEHRPEIQADIYNNVVEYYKALLEGVSYT